MRKRARRIRLRPAQRRAPPGSPPGLLIGDPTAADSKMTLLSYGPDGAQENAIATIAELETTWQRAPVAWVRVEGLKNTSLLRQIGELFHLHPLCLEDVLNVHQRPKVDEFHHFHFVVSRVPCSQGRDIDDQTPGTEQLSFFLGKNFVLSFHERGGPLIDTLRRRILENVGRIRALGPDYLAYCLIDGAIDSFFPILEELGLRLEVLEERMLARLHRSAVWSIHDIKRQLIGLRRAIWPQREAVNVLVRDRTELISDETRVFLRDCQDHAFQVVELLEMYRELGSDLTDLYLSMTSHRLNEVMKVLTVIATIFIPLTFIVGVYGMNFDTNASPWNMPELKWRYGYPACLALMAGIAAGLLLYFQRKGWLEDHENAPLDDDGDGTNPAPHADRAATGAMR